MFTFLVRLLLENQREIDVCKDIQNDNILLLLCFTVYHFMNCEPTFCVSKQKKRAKHIVPLSRLRYGANT